MYSKKILREVCKRQNVRVQQAEVRLERERREHGRFLLQAIERIQQAEARVQLEKERVQRAEEMVQQERKGARRAEEKVQRARQRAQQAEERAHQAEEREQRDREEFRWRVQHAEARADELQK